VPAKTESNDDLMCIAKNIYFEARNQSTIGQIAVALVTKNRAEDPSWPATMCGVVLQAIRYIPGTDIPARNMCKFSWYCDGKADTVNYKSKAWQKALDIAAIVLFTTRYDGLLQKATFYHNKTVKPTWAKHLIYITTIDNHLFYRRP
jgi:spore germination cell wall hydrolase CwlJ-like protein